MTSTAWLFVLFGCLGIVGEVFFTALQELVRTRRFRLNGGSYLWMFPIYGLIAFLFPPLNDAVGGLPWPIRGLIYMAGFFVVEFVTGTLLTTLTGAHIWQYTDRLNVRGQITFWYAPVWFGVGLLVERYFSWALSVSRALAHHS